MTHEERSVLEQALRYLGRSTSSQYGAHTGRCVIHGMVMSAIFCQIMTDALDDVDKAARALWLRDCHLLPEAGIVT